MSRKSKGKTVFIETVEGPCEGLINSATDSDLELPRGYESQSQESKGFHKHFTIYSKTVIYCLSLKEKYPGYTYVYYIDKVVVKVLVHVKLNLSVTSSKYVLEFLN